MVEFRLVVTALALLLAMFLAGVHGLRHRVGIAILGLLSLVWFTVDKLFEGELVFQIDRHQGLTTSDFVGLLGLVITAALWWQSRPARMRRSAPAPVAAVRRPSPGTALPRFSSAPPVDSAPGVGPAPRVEESSVSRRVLPVVAFSDELRGDEGVGWLSVCAVGRRISVCVELRSDRGVAGGCPRKLAVGPDFRCQQTVAEKKSPYFSVDRPSSVRRLI